MIDFELLPGKGTDKIKFDFTIQEIKRVLEKELKCNDIEFDDEYKILRAFESSVQITFNKNNKAEFIEFYSDKNLVVNYNGQDLFDIEADKVVELLKTNDQLKGEEFGPTFINKIIALSDPDEQYDYKKEHQRKIWFTIGIGNKDYLESIKEYL